MGVDRAAVTPAEAAQYRAAGWWTDTTLSDCVQRNASSTPDKVAYIDFSLAAPGHHFNWAEFDCAATNLAHDLVDLGVTPGHRVALWHKDSAAIHIALTAIERCGAAAVGLGARAGVREVAHILHTTRPALLVSDIERGQSAKEAAYQVDPNLRAVIVGDRHADLVLGTEARSIAASLSPTGPDDVFLINSTSGTTGMPKCVVHTQNRWHYFHTKAVENGNLNAHDVFLPVIPTPFGFGIWTSHTTPIHLGATTVRIERFDAAATCAAIERHRVTVLCCVSTQLAMLLADPASRQRDLSSLRVVFTGGEPLPYTQATRFEELTGATILQFYGSNETGMLSATTVADPVDRRLRTAGRIVPEMQVRLFDGDLDVTATGRGQPACRGPALSLGYLHGSDHDKLFTNDGWMRMGDICELDADGYVTLTGRTSDFILRAGKNISAVQVEEAVATHPAVAVAAAVAMPDALFGERVCVFAELVQGGSLDLPELIEHLLQQGISKELLPERLEVVGELPRSSGGKIAKGRLRDEIRSALGQS
jgi:acyl-CoA synthetase